MATLTIFFDTTWETGFRLAGLSLKKLKGTNFGHHLEIRDFDRRFYVDNQFIADGNTAQIKQDVLVKYLTELQQVMPFDKIRFVGVAHGFTPDELMAAVKENLKS